MIIAFKSIDQKNKFLLHTPHEQVYHTKTARCCTRLFQMKQRIFKKKKTNKTQTLKKVIQNHDPEIKSTANN